MCYSMISYNMHHIMEEKRRSYHTYLPTYLPDHPPTNPLARPPARPPAQPPTHIHA